MAVLGIGGRLYLKREAPDPCLVSSTAIDGFNNALATICPGYWSGDQVVVSCLPVGTGNFPPNPEGYGTYYGGQYFLGPNRSQIANYYDNFYKDGTEEYPDGEFGDDSQFYSRVGDVSGGEEIQPCTDQDYWIHIDQLGYVSFYNSRCEALTGDRANRVPLNSNVAGTIGIAPYGSTDYNNAIWQCFASFGVYQFSDVQDAITLESICNFAPTYQQPVPGTSDYDNANVLPRQLGGTEYALVRLNFGTTAEIAIGCALEDLRASLVVEVYLEKGYGPARAQSVADDVMTALYALNNRPKQRVDGVLGRVDPITGPAFTSLVDQPYFVVSMSCGVVASVA